MLSKNWLIFASENSEPRIILRFFSLDFFVNFLVYSKIWLITIVTRHVFNESQSYCAASYRGLRISDLYCIHGPWELLKCNVSER